MAGPNARPNGQELGLVIGSVVVLLLIVVLVLVQIAALPWDITIRWVFSAILAIAILIVFGYAVSRRLDGVLIDERNMISLSRFQIVLWTIVVFVSLLSLVGARARALELHQYEVLGISPDQAKDYNVGEVAIPGSLLVLMGISATSLVGAPVLRSITQYNKKPDLERALPSLRASQLSFRGETDLMALRTAGAGGAPLSVVGMLNDEGRGVVGNVLVNLDASGAKWTDVIRGELVSNAGQIDLTKLQNLFFTLFIVLIYIGSVYQALSQPVLPDALPDLTESMVVLVGISHAGYLTAKGTQSAPQEGERQVAVA